MKWKPANTAPKSGRIVLGWDSSKEEVDFVYTPLPANDSKWARIGCFELEDGVITHWMPVPKPPHSMRKKSR